MQHNTMDVVNYEACYNSLCNGNDDIATATLRCLHTLANTVARISEQKWR